MDMVYSGVYLPRFHRERLNEIALSLGCSRNKAIQKLIEAAEVESQPVLSVKTNRHDAKTLTERNVTAVAA